MSRPCQTCGDPRRIHIPECTGLGCDCTAYVEPPEPGPNQLALGDEPTPGAPAYDPATSDWPEGF